MLSLFLQFEKVLASSFGEDEVDTCPHNSDSVLNRIAHINSASTVSLWLNKLMTFGNLPTKTMLLTFAFGNLWVELWILNPLGSYLRNHFPKAGCLIILEIEQKVKRLAG